MDKKREGKKSEEIRFVIGFKALSYQQNVGLFKDFTKKKGKSCSFLFSRNRSGH